MLASGYAVTYAAVPLIHGLTLDRTFVEKRRREHHAIETYSTDPARRQGIMTTTEEPASNLAEFDKKLDLLHLRGEAPHFIIDIRNAWIRRYRD